MARLPKKIGQLLIGVMLSCIGFVSSSCSATRYVMGNEATTQCDPIKMQCQLVSIGYIKAAEETQIELIRTQQALKICREKK